MSNTIKFSKKSWINGEAKRMSKRTMFITPLIIMSIITVRNYIIRKKIEKERNEYVNLRDGFVTLAEWLVNKTNGKSLAECLLKHNYSTIAIYGIGDIGRLLHSELKGSDIEIKCFIDRNAEGIGSFEQIPVVSRTEFSKRRDADAIIILPMTDYNATNKELIKIGITLPTVSLKDIVFEI